MIAHAIGVPPGDGCRCFVCGDSPFRSAGSWQKALGVGFSDWDCCEDRYADDVCEGCLRILSGRPGDDPPPLRTRTIAVIDGALSLPTIEETWSLLRSPPAGLQVLSWAVSKQKHHALYAELSTPSCVRLGSDSRTIDYRPERDDLLVEAVLRLRGGDEKGRAWFTRDEILSGYYPPPKIARSASRWAEAEAVILPRRGDAVLSLIVSHAPVTAADQHTEDLMTDDIDNRVVALLAALAQDSQHRRRDGLAFWQSLFLRRIQRHSGRPFAAFAARMLDDLAVEPHSAGARAVAEQVAVTRSDDEIALMQRLRERPVLLLALVYQSHQLAVEARKPKAKPAPAPVVTDDFPPDAMELF
ncbi:MAG: hypothetical protein RJA99_4258 [Pseudomonadota bacterium]|jgi:hypothetical protein